MVSKLNILMIRHGMVSSEFRNRYVGHSDLDLSPEGQAEVLELSSTLREYVNAKKINFNLNNIHLILCSPLKRAIATKELLTLKAKEAEIVNELAEISFGKWELKSFQEIEKQYPEQLQSWLNDPGNFKFPEGESVLDFRARASKVKKILEDEAVKEDGNEKGNGNGNGSNIVLIAHKGVIQHLICLFLGIPFNHYCAFQVETASAILIEYYMDGLGILSSIIK